MKQKTEKNTYDFSLFFDVEKYDDANAEELQVHEILAFLHQDQK